MSKTVLNYEPLIFSPKKADEKTVLSDIQKEILSLKKERNAIILAHNYQIEAIQEVADFVGDSLDFLIKRKKQMQILLFSVAFTLWPKLQKS